LRTPQNTAPRRVTRSEREDGYRSPLRVLARRFMTCSEVGGGHDWKRKGEHTGGCTGRKREGCDGGRMVPECLEGRRGRGSTDRLDRQRGLKGSAEGVLHERTRGTKEKPEEEAEIPRDMVQRELLTGTEECLTAQRQRRRTGWRGIRNGADGQRYREN
jgi:hypothetical protein